MLRRQMCAFCTHKLLKGEETHWPQMHQRKKMTTSSGDTEGSWQTPAPDLGLENVSFFHVRF